MTRTRRRRFLEQVAAGAALSAAAPVTRDRRFPRPRLGPDARRRAV